jgi:hypothetical protein
MEMKVNNEDQQRKSTKINVYKTRKIIINDDHHQNGNHRRSSTRKSSMCGMNINMGNVNCHERALSNESHHIVGGMLFCQ